MFKTATEAADWIQGARYKGQKNGLENMRALLTALGNPQNQFRSVHIAGTNGKGSTAAYTESILRQAGYRTGMYTSPYLITYNERVQVMGKPIPDADLISLTSRIRQVTERLLEKNVFPTTFELGTALAFAYFAQQQVDFAVIEVGIGGRIPPTSSCRKFRWWPPSGWITPRFWATPWRPSPGKRRAFSSPACPAWCRISRIPFCRYFGKPPGSGAVL